MRRKAIKIQSMARQIATRERLREEFVYVRFMETLPLMLMTKRSVFDRELNLRVNQRRHDMIRATLRGAALVSVRVLRRRMCCVWLAVLHTLSTPTATLLASVQKLIRLFLFKRRILHRCVSVCSATHAVLAAVHV